MLSLVFPSILLTFVSASPVLYGKNVGIKEGNNIINPGIFTFVVHLEVTTNIIHKEKPYQLTGTCGGVILKNDVVLTAAHCIGQKKNPKIYVWAGVVDINKQKENGDRIAVKRYILHENFNVKRAIPGPDDIALLWLQKSFNMANSFIAVAPIAQLDFNIAGKSGWIAGWGADENGEKSALKTAYLAVIPQDECQSEHSGIRISKTVICGRSKNRICGGNFGDSGGPFIIDGKVVGLFSFGSAIDKFINGKKMTICDPKKPAIFTDVTKYNKWISVHLNTANKQINKQM